MVAQLGEAVRARRELEHHLVETPWRGMASVAPVERDSRKGWGRIDELLQELAAEAPLTLAEVLCGHGVCSHPFGFEIMPSE